MKSGSSLVVDYFFHPMQIPILNDLVTKYNYEPITVLLDSSIERAYKKFIKRNESKERPEVISIEISYEDFERSAKVNRDFRYGEHKIIVNTDNYLQNKEDDFDISNFDSVIDNIRNLLLPIWEHLMA